MSRIGESIARLRALSRWYAFGFLMASIWPLVLLYGYPAFALLIALPAFVLFFIATTRPRVPTPAAEETPNASP